MPCLLFCQEARSRSQRVCFFCGLIFPCFFNPSLTTFCLSICFDVPATSSLTLLSSLSTRSSCWNNLLFYRLAWLSYFLRSTCAYSNFLCSKLTLTVTYFASCEGNPIQALLVVLVEVLRYFFFYFLLFLFLSLLYFLFLKCLFSLRAEVCFS